MSKQLILGNWKMNKNINDILEFCSSFNALCKDKNNINFIKNTIISIAPTYVGLIPFYSKINPIVSLMAQNVSDEISGAKTGQVSVSMLKGLQVKYCLIGHSEVRQYLKETNEMINKKIKLLINENIVPVLCIGESLSEFENNKTNLVLKTQLEECLKDINVNESLPLIIAYEPIWAIGTGKTATNEIIKDSMSTIKKYLNDLFKDKCSSFKVVYGGSVNEKNAKEILHTHGVDGVLVGGASLDSKKFMEIITSANVNE
jgi:triosephosphate isomerase